MPLATFNSLAGVPTHYDRFDSPASISFGTRGKLNSFSAEDNFVDRLNDCFEELWKLVPLGRAEVITSAGAGTRLDAPDSSDFHSLARAFDLDGLFWAGREFVTLDDGFRGGDRKFYFGVNAVLCKHFGVVLNYLFNADHRDHFHIDDSRNVGFDSGASSKVLFLQGALVHVMGLNIGATGIDGNFGAATLAALNTALSQFGITGSINTQSVWLDFLTAIAKKAFGSPVAFSKSVSFTTPVDGTSLPSNIVTFTGKADPGVVKVRLRAEDMFDVGSIATVDGSNKWTTSHTFSKTGRREIIAKGFDTSGTQVASTKISITVAAGFAPIVPVSDGLTFTSPSSDSKFNLGTTVSFTGTATTDIVKVKLLAEDKFNVGSEARVSSGKWNVSYNFTQGGNRKIIAKGFDSIGNQVASAEINIVLNAVTGYSPPSASASLLGTIPSLLTTQLPKSFLGSKVIFSLPAGQIYIDADMDIDADGSPNARTLDPCCGQLETSLRFTTGDFVDAEKVPYFVLPQGFYTPQNINLGDIAAVIYKDKIEYAVFADAGPSHKMGEGSIALSRSLGNEPLIGGVVRAGIDDDVIYIVFPGSGDGTPQTPDAIRATGKALFNALGGSDKP